MQLEVTILLIRTRNPKVKPHLPTKPALPRASAHPWEGNPGSHGVHRLKETCSTKLMRTRSPAMPVGTKLSVWPRFCPPFLKTRVEDLIPPTITPDSSSCRPATAYQWFGNVIFCNTASFPPQQRKLRIRKVHTRFWIPLPPSLYSTSNGLSKDWSDCKQPYSIKNKISLMGCNILKSFETLKIVVIVITQRYLLQDPLPLLPAPHNALLRLPTWN